MLKINDLLIKFMNEIIIEAHNISITKGECVLLSGAIGSGKSTFLKTLFGIYEPKLDYNFNIEVLGKKLIECTDMFFRENIMYIEQEDIFLFKYKKGIDEIINRLGIYQENMSKEEIIHFCNKFQINVDKILNRRINKMSGGEKKIISLITGLLLGKNRKIILIDEPLNNLDIETAKKISNILHYFSMVHRKTLLIISHNNIFPFISTKLTFDNNIIKIQENEIQYFQIGELDNKGYYK